MEAKDTVMVEPQMEIALKDYGLFAINAYPLEIYTLLKAQAGISFKAGIKEVVEWLVNNDFVDELPWDTWSAKLKEWGLDTL